MRAIDADALIDDLKHDVAVDQDSLDYEELTDLNRKNIQFDKDCKQNAIDLLQHAPTIEPQRTKGMWIEHNPHKWGLGIVFECSECGEKIDCEPSNFCPNCGAEMEDK